EGRPRQGRARPRPREAAARQAPRHREARGGSRDPACPEIPPLTATISLTNIRGRPGFDVVGSPAELQAEVPGRPRKTTGNQRKCEGQLRTRTRGLSRYVRRVAPGSARGPGSGVNERARRGGRANRPKPDTKGWLARRLVGCQPAGGRNRRAA